MDLTVPMYSFAVLAATAFAVAYIPLGSYSPCQDQSQFHPRFPSLVYEGDDVAGPVDSAWS